MSNLTALPKIADAVSPAARAYAPKPVDESMLASLIDAAIQAPSALNEQPWAFTVVTNKELLDRISNSAKAYLLGTSALGMGPSRFRDQLANPDFDILYNAPALIIISAVGATPWAVEDCALGRPEFDANGPLDGPGDLLDRICAALASNRRWQVDASIPQPLCAGSSHHCWLSSGAIAPCCPPARNYQVDQVGATKKGGARART